jgi:hypothetical protein
MIVFINNIRNKYKYISTVYLNKILDEITTFFNTLHKRPVVAHALDHWTFNTFLLSYTLGITKNCNKSTAEYITPINK